MRIEKVEAQDICDSSLYLRVSDMKIRAIRKKEAILVKIFQQIVQDQKNRGIKTYKILIIR